MWKVLGSVEGKLLCSELSLYLVLYTPGTVYLVQYTTVLYGNVVVLVPGTCMPRIPSIVQYLLCLFEVGKKILSRSRYWYR